MTDAMSFALDTNILVYASDSSSPFHARASELLASCASGREIFYLTWGTLMSYLRLATHPAVSRRPLTPEEAKIFACLKIDSLTPIDELVDRTGFSVSELLARLLDWELRGWISQHPGKCFQRRI